MWPYIIIYTYTQLIKIILIFLIKKMDSPPWHGLLSKIRQHFVWYDLRPNPSTRLSGTRLLMYLFIYK